MATASAIFVDQRLRFVGDRRIELSGKSDVHRCEHDQAKQGESDREDNEICKAIL